MARLRPPEGVEEGDIEGLLGMANPLATALGLASRSESYTKALSRLRSKLLLDIMKKYGSRTPPTTSVPLIALDEAIQKRGSLGLADFLERAEYKQSPKFLRKYKRTLGTQGSGEYNPEKIE